MALQIVGAGFGRTGTNSLKLALEQLGFGPCHHMLEVIEKPEQIAFWTAAGRNERRDWDAGIAGYRSAVDWPSAFYWRELADHYPDAKVLLTLRPEDDWLRSINSTIFTNLRTLGQRPPGPGRDLGEMAYEIIVRRTFGGNIDDLEHVLGVYRAHIAAVQAQIAPARLLVFDPTEGWGPLCTFLRAPVPATPYPRTNTTEDYLARSSAHRATAEKG